MADPVELILGDLTDKYAKEPASDAFMRLYTDDERFGRVFASLHERLNDRFVAINDRARSTRHYWADNSRALIALIDELAETIGVLRRVGFDVSFREDYDAAVRRCKPWLSTGGGSAVPEDFEPIEIVRYEPVFIRSETTVKLKKQSAAVKLQLIGEGSYAHVFFFVDPDYGIKIAVKRAKKGLDERNPRNRKSNPQSYIRAPQVPTAPGWRPGARRCEIEGWPPHDRHPRTIEDYSKLF